MEFKTDAQKSTYELVGKFMKEIFGEMAVAEQDHPTYGYVSGSAAVRVMALPWGDDNSIVNIWSWVVTGAESTPELMSMLLHENRDMRFGAFSLDNEDDICFEHTIVGSTLDKEELKASVLAVASIADQYDDIIKSKFGGQTAFDR